MKDYGYNLLKSRKFWAAVVGVIYSMVYLVWPDFPIPEESVIGVVGTVVSYILGVALEDGLSKKNGVDLQKYVEKAKSKNEYDEKADA
jgi:hypothetical protein